MLCICTPCLPLLARTISHANTRLLARGPHKNGCIYKHVHLHSRRSTQGRISSSLSPRCAAAIYLCYYASSAATSLHAQSALPISQFRLTVNQTRGQCHARDFKAPSVAFSLAGRRISAAKFNVEWEFKGGMPTAVASFAEGVKISAWSFTTADGSNPSCDPILFSAQRFVETKRGAGAGAGAEAGWGINSSRCGNEEDGTCGAGDTCSSRSHNLCGEWVELRQPGWMSNKQLSSEEMVRSGAAQVSVERQSEAYFDMSPPMSKYCEVRGIRPLGA